MSRRPSLRELAARCGCTHQALTKAFDERRLTAGIARVKGKIVVTDADAALVQWKAIRQPRPTSRRASDDVNLEASPEHRRAGSDEARDDDAPPPYEVSRARREAALAEIAEVEARQLSGGQWLPIAAFEELEQKYAELFAFCVRHLRHRLPLAVHARCDLRAIIDQQLRSKAAEGSAPAAQPDANALFRLTMSSVQDAVDDVCNELADLVSKMEDLVSKMEADDLASGDGA